MKIFYDKIFNHTKFWFYTFVKCYCTLLRNWYFHFEHPWQVVDLISHFAIIIANLRLTHFADFTLIKILHHMLFLSHNSSRENEMSWKNGLKSIREKYYSTSAPLKGKNRNFDWINFNPEGWNEIKRMNFSHEGTYAQKIHKLAKYVQACEFYTIRVFSVFWYGTQPAKMHYAQSGF